MQSTLQSHARFGWSCLAGMRSAKEKRGVTRRLSERQRGGPNAFAIARGLGARAPRDAAAVERQTAHAERGAPANEIESSQWKRSRKRRHPVGLYPLLQRL